MRLNTSQQILQYTSLRWSCSFIFVAGVYACLALVAFNRPPANQIILAPLTSTVTIDLPPLATISEAKLQTKPEPAREQIPLKTVSELPRIKTAKTILPSHTKPKIKKDTLPNNKKPVLKKKNPENIEPTAEAVPPAPIPAKEPSSASPSQASAAWQSNLLTHIQRYKRYPQQARRRGQEAVIYVRVTITQNGQVIKHQLEKASKYKALNKEVLTLITRAQPLPSPPKELSSETLEILLPVVFSLRH
ncbi:MAG: energy transducer TonB [Gammaproteobacteria bacterium]|nr:energy transducer TonB [Gammaproteobacteria bacterium]